MIVFFGEHDGRSVVALSQGGRTLAEVSGLTTSDQLELLEQALVHSHARLEDLTGIVVDRGPGGFSTVRRRVAVAAGLSRSLDLPLAAVTGPFLAEDAAILPETDFVRKARIEPLYAGAPNITASRKKKTWTAR